MLRRAALERSGLFDPVFDRGPRADHDLGMRLHLSGALLVYDPDVLVFHHHAPAGGLRTHGARSVTRASSRRSLTQRNLPAVTQLYIGYRYGTARQRREDLAMATITPISGDGPTSRQVVRALLQIAVLAVHLPDDPSHRRHRPRWPPAPLPRCPRWTGRPTRDIEAGRL